MIPEAGDIAKYIAVGIAMPCSGEGMFFLRWRRQREMPGSMMIYLGLNIVVVFLWRWNGRNREN